MKTTHSQRFHPPILFPLALVLAAVLPGTASASPLFGIGNGASTSWTAATPNLRAAGSGGSPSPVDDQSSAFQFYSGQIGLSMGGAPAITEVKAAQNIRLYTDVLVPDAAFGGSDVFDSLVMSWDADPDETVLNVAAWDYVYDVDPDLTGLEIKFSLLAPPGVWDFSLELFDVFGSSIGWFGVPPGTTWTSVVIDPSVQAPQGPFTAFFAGANNGNAFDLTQVAFIRLNESSQSGVSFGTFPLTGGPVILPGQPWNAWNHLYVTTPEPATLLLLGLGLLGVVMLRTREPPRRGRVGLRRAPRGVAAGAGAGWRAH